MAAWGTAQLPGHLGKKKTQIWGKSLQISATTLLLGSKGSEFVKLTGLEL